MRSWSATIRTAWGKTDQETLAWLPVVRHLEDAAAVAGVLWDRWLPHSVRAAISADLPGGLNDGRILTCWLAGVHDCGKLSPQFAAQLIGRPGFGSVIDGMERAGLDVPNRAVQGRLERHDCVGQAMLHRWLVDRHGFPPLSAGRLASIVGAHHGVPPSQTELGALVRDPSRFRSNEVWASVQDEALVRMTMATGAGDRLPAWSRVRMSGSAAMLAAAVVVVADWIASDTGRFPYDDTDNSADRARRAAGAGDFPAPWRPTSARLTATALMQRRFPQVGFGVPRPLQRAAADAARAADKPPLIIIEAGMGEGKTEAALLAAEILAERFGSGGVVFALPTQATSDGIFPRLLHWTRHLDSGTQSIFLAHGKAGLNEDYQGIVWSGGPIRGVDIDGPRGRTEGEVVVSEWLRGRRRGVLANMVVGTIDQVLFGALKARYVQLRQLALAGKVVIIDEAHAADEFMRVYLLAVLRWLAAYGAPVIVMTATLPPEVREQFVQAYEGSISMLRPPVRSEIADDAYPRLTVTGARRRDWPVPAGGHVERHVQISRSDDDEWQTQVVRAVEDGACVAVISNTVRTARETYRTLRSRLGANRVGLLHSQFLAPHRLIRERRLREMLGPPDPRGRTPSRPRGYVICATQVIEQSLDIDVDLMVSAVAPIDLLLQRMGRLHRHVRGVGECERPAHYRTPQLILTGVRDEEGVPQLDRGSVAVYGASRLLRALAVLSGGATTVRLPVDIPALVRTGYDRALMPPSGWEQVWQAAEQRHLEEVTAREERAGSFCLPGPAEVGPLTGLLNGRTEDPEQAAARAGVRDSDDSLEVLVVRRVPDGLAPLPGTEIEDVLLPGELDAPEPNVARTLSTHTVRLPRVLSAPWAIDDTIRALEGSGRDLVSWQQSIWLSGELVLILDPDMTTMLNAVRVSYDLDLGLLCDREDAS